MEKLVTIMMGERQDLKHIERELLSFHYNSAEVKDIRTLSARYSVLKVGERELVGALKVAENYVKRTNDFLYRPLRVSFVTEEINEEEKEIL